MTPGVLLLLACCLAGFSFIAGVATVKHGEDGSVGIPAVIMTIVLLIVFGFQMVR